MKGVRNLLWLIPGFFVVTGPVWWRPVSDFLKPRGNFDTAAKTSNDKIKTFSLDGMILTQSRGNHREMRLQSQHVYTVNSDEKLQLEQVEANLYGKNKDDVHVKSDSGIFETKSQKLILHDKVLITARQGQALRTEQLTFFAKDKKLTTDKEVQMAANNMAIKGTGMSYDVETGILVLGGRVYFEAW